MFGGPSAPLSIEHPVAICDRGKHEARDEPGESLQEASTMADPKQRTGETRERSRSQTQGIQRSGSGIQRRSFPSLFSLTPNEFFRMSPFGLMRRFAEERDRNFWGWGTPARGISEEEIAWTPSVEIRESGNNLVIAADLPGLSEDDVKVEATEDGLVIQGERTQEESKEEGGVQRSERSYGRFYRLIALPEGAKIDEAKASFNNGGLRFSLLIKQRRQRGVCRSRGLATRLTSIAKEQQRTAAGTTFQPSLNIHIFCFG
jgi:HSP20 family protein